MAGLEYSSSVDDSYRIITQVEQVHYNGATIYTVFPDYPEDKPQRFDLSYNPENGTLEYNNSTLSPVNKPTSTSESDK